MLLMTVILFGLVISLGIIGCMMYYFTDLALNKDDITTIDPIPSEDHTDPRDNR